MLRKEVGLFNLKTLLTRANGGRNLLPYRRKQVIFAQGDPADAVFYIQEGKVKVTVVSSQGKEAVIAPSECG